MSEVKLSADELEEIKDDARFKERVILGIKSLGRSYDKLPCETRSTQITKMEKCITAITTQVYFQWGVLGVILYTIIKG